MPWKRARNADSSAGIGALANRSSPSGSAPQRRCTKPNSQFSPRLSTQHQLVERQNLGRRRVSLAIEEQPLEGERDLAVVGGAADVAWPCRAGMTKSDRDPLAIRDRRPGHGTFDSGDLADEEVADRTIVHRDCQALHREGPAPDKGAEIEHHPVSSTHGGARQFEAAFRSDSPGMLGFRLGPAAAAVDGAITPGAKIDDQRVGRLFQLEPRFSLKPHRSVFGAALTRALAWHYESRAKYILTTYPGRKR